jgi:hypothetical protein
MKAGASSWPTINLCVRGGRALLPSPAEPNKVKFRSFCAANSRNDETLKRIYIGRKFKNDTERPEKLFELHTKMTKRNGAKKAVKTGKRVKP